MPGIVGFITTTGHEGAKARLLRMVASMRHEPFYTTGTWMDPSAGIYLGWVERQGSFSAGMPVQNERGNVVLVFSGEDFPEPGTAQRLRQSGHAVDEQGPSYLAHLAEEFEDFPKCLNGRFHGLLIQRALGQAVLFNDRYGMQRLYWHENADAFYFAAEAKAILAVCAEARAIDQRSLGEFIACGCTLENRTLFQDVALLPPGSAWTFRDGKLRSRQQYFAPSEWEEQETLNETEFYERLRTVFSANLPRYFAGPQPAAMSLTGGIDSRLILAWRQPAPGTLPCYSFGGTYRDCQDVIMARRIARECGQEHQVIEVGDEFLTQFPHYAERTVYLTDGSLEVKRAPDLYVNERARQIAPVRMTGNYGSETLRQSRTFKPVEVLEGLFTPEVGAAIDTAHRTYSQITSGHPLSFSAFRQAPWHLFCSLGLEQTQLTLRSPFLDNDLVRTMFQAPPHSTSDETVCLRLIADGSRRLRAIRTDRGSGGNAPHFLAGLQRAYLNFTFRAEYAFDYGMPQTVARIDHALRSLHLEKLFLGRHKFYHFRIWYRDALANYVRETLLDSRSLSRPYVDGNVMRRAVERHLRGERNYTSELHRLLTLELVHRLFIDNEIQAPAAHAMEATAGAAQHAQFAGPR
jgi:asparagine synthase (glutamine-hydrolysing)